MELSSEIDYITIENQEVDFPRHFHETFCISLIKRGIEQIEFGTHSILSESGTISITNPYEVHANPVVNSDLKTSFDTIYISKDVMKYFVGNNIILNTQINEGKVLREFLSLRNSLAKNNPKINETHLTAFIDAIHPFSKSKNESEEMMDLTNLQFIEKFIDYHIKERFTVNQLAQLASLNKFGFIKKFKSYTGLSPMNYVIMKKVFSAKSLITKDINLSELAYDYNFTDLAHFSKTFKRYIGICPSAYKLKL